MQFLILSFILIGVCEGAQDGKSFISITVTLDFDVGQVKSELKNVRM